MNHRISRGLLAVILTVTGVQAHGWVVVECPDARQPLLHRYRVDQSIDPLTDVTRWKALRDDQNCIASIKPVTESGAQRIQMDYTFIGKQGLEYASLEHSVQLNALPPALTVRVKGSRLDFIHALRLEDAKGEIHQFTGEAEPAEGWSRVVYLLQNGHSWGGDNNRQLDLPVRRLWLVFDKPAAGFKAKGWVRLADLATAQPIQKERLLRIEADADRFGRLYRPGEPVALRAMTTQGQVRWSAHDYFGTRLAGGTSNQQTSIRFTPPSTGYYRVLIEGVHDGAVRDAREYHLAVIRDQPAVQNAFLGFNTHFGQGHYPMECMDLMRRYGFTRFRDEIPWGAVEVERGQYALPELAQRYLSYARQRGMQPLVILDYANDLYDGGGFPNSPEGIAGFAGYAAALARLSADTVSEYEIWNEWIGGCGMDGKPGDHGPEAYGRLMRAVAEAVHAVRPGAMLVGIGGEYGPDCPENVAAMFRSAGRTSVQAWSIHPYRYPSPPEASGLSDEIARIRNAALNAGAPDRIWATEAGYPTHYGRAGVDERTQARYAVRTAAILQVKARLHRYYWYDLKNDGTDLNYNEHNFGVVHHQRYGCAPKPAMVALSVFQHATAGYVPAGYAVNGAVHIAKYSRASGQDLWLVWSTDGSPSIRLTGRSVQVRDMMGRPVNGAVHASPDVLYVTGRGLRLR